MDVTVLDTFTGSGTSSTSATITPTPGKLYLVLIEVYDPDVNGPPGLSVAGCGLTWDTVEDTDSTPMSIEFGDDSEGLFELFWAVGTPEEGEIVVTHNDSSVTYCGVLVIEVGGVDLVDPIRQAKRNGGVGNTMSVTLGAFESASHATFGFFTNIEGQAVAPGSGFTEIIELNGLQAEWKSSNDTGVDATTTSTPEWVAFGIEVAPAAFTGSGSPQLPKLTASASGTTQTAQTGIASMNLPQLTASATGLLQPSGTAADALPALTASASGYMQPDGSGAPSLPALTARATGAQTAAGEIAGDVGAMLPSLTMAATGGAIAGAGTPSLPALTAAATGANVYSGTAAARLGGLMAAVAGASVPLGGSFRTSYHRNVRPARRQFR